MPSDDGPKAVVGDPFAGRCDHICLLDDGHVERGQLHFYGYELPSPRTRGRAELAAEVRAHLEAEIANWDKIAAGLDHIGHALPPIQAAKRAALVDMLAWLDANDSIIRTSPKETT